MRVQRRGISYSPLSIAFSVCVSVHVRAPPKVAVYIRWMTELFRYLRRGFKHGRERQKPPPYLSAARQEPSPTSGHLTFILKAGNLEHQNAEV